MNYGGGLVRLEYNLKTRIEFFKLICSNCKCIVYTPMYLFFRLRISTCPKCDKIILQSEKRFEDE